MMLRIPGMVSDSVGCVKLLLLFHRKILQNKYEYWDVDSLASERELTIARGEIPAGARTTSESSKYSTLQVQ